MKSDSDFLPKTLLTIFIIIFLSQVIDAGTRYRDQVFTSADTLKNIQYGNSTGLDGLNFPLMLDIYLPLGDTAIYRPLVIFIHGGSLVSGVKSEMEAICVDYAKRGFVTATIEYRLGIVTPKTVKTVLEALLRGVQDTKAAVRFFRANAEEYGIDTSKIFLQGSSAGSMIAVHYAYWDQDEIPIDVDQSKWGNIEGTGGNPGYSSKIAGIVNYCGAIVDPAWINAGEPPVANFHGLLDQVVPPDDAVSPDFNIRLHGGVAVSRMASEAGIYNQWAFFPQMGHGGNEDSLRIFGSNFFYTLMVLSSSAVQDFILPQLCIKNLKIFKFDDYNFYTTVLDKSGNRIIMDPANLQYSCDSKIGSISPYGLYKPGNNEARGYVFSSFNGNKDSCSVQTYDLKYFVVKPGAALVDTNMTLQIKIDTYDADSLKHNLALTKFRLISSVQQVGTIDSMGLFTAKKNGTTRIIASCSGFRDTCIITVQSASGLRNLDDAESLTGWSFSGENLDSLYVTISSAEKSSGNSSIKIDYKFTFSSSKNFIVNLDKNIGVYGIPDSIYLDSKSDGRKHKLFYLFSDANGGTWKASAKRYLNDSLNFALINTPMNPLAQVNGSLELNYPLELNRIQIQLAGESVPGRVASGTIYIDNIRLKYPGENTPAGIPADFTLQQNYPNPFNASTQIEFDLHSDARVTLKIFDVLGREVAVLVNTDLTAGYYSIPFNALRYASGPYFYSLQTNARTEIKKMILLK